MKKQRLLGHIVFCCLTLAGTFESGAQNHVYFAIGANGGNGSGSNPQNPYDASGENFDIGLYDHSGWPGGIIVHLAPGTYLTAGRLDSDPPYVDLSIIGSGSSGGSQSEIKLSVPPDSVTTEANYSKSVLMFSGDITLQAVKLNCNSTEWPDLRAKFNGVVLLNGSLNADDVVITNLRGDWQGYEFVYTNGMEIVTNIIRPESFGVLLVPTSLTKATSLNNIQILDIQGDVDGTIPNLAYVTPVAGVNYIDQYVYITNLHVATGTNLAVCAFSPYGRNYVVRNVTNTGMVGAGMWGDSDGRANATIENVNWTGGQIVAQSAIKFWLNTTNINTKVSNVTVTDVQCDHGPLAHISNDSPAREGIMLGGLGLEVDGLSVSNMVCSWPAVSLPYSTSTFPSWHMGPAYLWYVKRVTNVVIKDSVFPPAHIDSGYAGYTDWVFIEGGTHITPPTLINCRDWYLLKEGFEGTGFETNGWTKSGSPNEDYTTTALYGSQSLNCVGAQYIWRNFQFSTRFNMYFRVRWNTWTDYHNVIYWDKTDYATTARLWADDNKLEIKHGSVTAMGTTTLSANTTYHVWVEWTKGTGSNGKMKLFISTNDTRPASPEANITTGNGIATERVYVGPSGSGPNVIFDRLLVDDMVH